MRLGYQPKTAELLHLAFWIPTPDDVAVVTIENQPDSRNVVEVTNVKGMKSIVPVGELARQDWSGKMQGIHRPDGILRDNLGEVVFHTPETFSARYGDIRPESA